MRRCASSQRLNFTMQFIIYSHPYINLEYKSLNEWRYEFSVILQGDNFRESSSVLLFLRVRGSWQCKFFFYSGKHSNLECFKFGSIRPHQRLWEAVKSSLKNSGRSYCNGRVELRVQVSFIFRQQRLLFNYKIRRWSSWRLFLKKFLDFIQILWFTQSQSSQWFRFLIMVSWCECHCRWHGAKLDVPI